MARMIEPDDLDFSAYMRQTDAAVKVRKASAFSESLAELFVPRMRGASFTAMHTTKLGRELEYRPGEVTVYAGFNGHRKSIFTGQVAIDLCAQNKRVLVASLEMMPAMTLARMARQALAEARPSKPATDRFARWTDDRLWLFDHVGRLTPAHCLAVLRYFADELDGEHVFLDSMMMVCASEEHLDEQKQFMTDLVRVAQETGLHVHLVAHCRKPQDETRPPTKYDLRGSAAISDQAHNIVMIWANKAKAQKVRDGNADEDDMGKPDALVLVEKQRNGEFEGRLAMWFEPASMRFCNDRLSAVDAFPELDAMHAHTTNDDYPEDFRP